jgi:hypothetical protein
MTGGSMAVRALGSTGCTTSSSSSMLPDVRFEFDRTRVLDPSVLVRCIFSVADVTLLRCLTDACIRVSLHRFEF